MKTQKLILVAALYRRMNGKVTRRYIQTVQEVKNADNR